MAARWLPSMTTGVTELDQQHQALIHHMNQLIEAKAEGRGKEELVATLDFLKAYSATHFAAEEALMARYGCPAAAGNEHAHAEFIRRFGELKSAVEVYGVADFALSQAVRELTDWYINHICECDTRLRAYVEAAG
jgi:hemerythrin